MVFRKGEYGAHVLLGFVVREKDLLRFVPIPDYVLARLIGGFVFASQIPFRVDDEALTTGEGFFEERVAGGEGHAVVPALDDEVDVGEHGDHFREAGGVMAEEVGAWEVEVGRKDGARDEWESGHDGG